MLSAKRLIKITLFLMVMLLGLEYLSVRFRSDRLSWIYYTEENTVDVLFLGSSAWYSPWIPAEAYGQDGIASFNYATGSYPADVSIYALREVLKKQKPQLVVMDARAYCYRDHKTYETDAEGNTVIKDNQLRAVTDTMPKGVNRFSILLALYGKKADELSEFFEIFFYHNRWKNLNIPAVFANGVYSWPGESWDYFKGYTTGYYGKTTEYEKPEDVSDIVGITPLSESTTTLIREFCQECDNNGIDVIFTVIPLADYDEEQHRQYNYIAKVVGEMNDVTDVDVSFLNLNNYGDEMHLDYSADFAEPMHPNYEGAKKITAFLSSYLSGHYELPDRRKEDFGTWQEDYRKYNKWMAALESGEQ